MVSSDCFEKHEEICCRASKISFYSWILSHGFIQKIYSCLTLCKDEKDVGSSEKAVKNMIRLINLLLQRNSQSDHVKQRYRLVMKLIRLTNFIIKLLKKNLKVCTIMIYITTMIRSLQRFFCPWAKAGGRVIYHLCRRICKLLGSIVRYE